MNMLKLDEPNIINWTIKYIKMNKELIQQDILIFGKYYDFIPHKDDYIALENNVYIVHDVVYDFDAEIIMVYVIGTK